MQFSRQQALRPRDVLLLANLGLALLPEQRLPGVAMREFPRDARLALRVESESAEPEHLALLARVSPSEQLASRWQVPARQPELRLPLERRESNRQQEALQVWLRERDRLPQVLLPERGPRV